MRILRNYCLREVLSPFLMSLGVFTFVMIMGNIIKLADMVVNKGVNIFLVYKLLLNLIPFLLTYTIPMSLLTAIILAFSRLSADNEIIAMKAVGLNLFKLSMPILTLSMLLCLSSIIINDKIIPAAHFATRRTIAQIGLKSPIAAIEAGTFINTFKNYIIFIYTVKKNKLQNIRIYQPQKDRPARTISAKEGEFVKLPDKNSMRLKLTDGVSDEPNPDNPNSFYKLRFQTYYITLNLGQIDDSKKVNKKPKDMTIIELKQEVDKIKSQGIKDLGPLLTEIHKKFSLAFACIAFCVIGIPLAVVTRRNEKSVAFGIALLVMMGYYLSFIAAEAISIEGVAPAWIMIWLPNIIFLGIGSFLSFKAVRQ